MDPEYSEPSKKRRRIGGVAQSKYDRQLSRTDRAAVKAFKLDTFGDKSRKAKKTGARIVAFMQEYNIMMLKYEEVEKLYNQGWDLTEIHKLDRAYLEKNRERAEKIVGMHTLNLQRDGKVMTYQKRNGYTKLVPMDLYPHNIETINNGEPRVTPRVMALDLHLLQKPVPKEVERSKNRRFAAYFEELMATYDPTRARNTGKFMGVPRGRALEDGAYTQAQSSVPKGVDGLTVTHDHKNATEASVQDVDADDVNEILINGLYRPRSYWRRSEENQKMDQNPAVSRYFVPKGSRKPDGASIFSGNYSLVHGGATATDSGYPTDERKRTEKMYNDTTESGRNYTRGATTVVGGDDKEEKTYNESEKEKEKEKKKDKSIHLMNDFVVNEDKKIKDKPEGMSWRKWLLTLAAAGALGYGLKRGIDETRQRIRRRMAYTTYRYPETQYADIGDDDLEAGGDLDEIVVNYDDRWPEQHLRRRHPGGAPHEGNNFTPLSQETLNDLLGSTDVWDQTQTALRRGALSNILRAPLEFPEEGLRDAYAPTESTQLYSDNDFFSRYREGS